MRDTLSSGLYVGLVLVAACVAQAASAATQDEPRQQICVSDRNDALERVIDSYWDAIKRMSVVRAIGVTEMTPVDVPDRIERIDADIRNYLRAAGGKRAVFILYAGRNSEGCAFVWTSSGETLYVQLPRSIGAVSDTVRRLLPLAEVEAHKRGKAARSRGLAPVGESVKKGDAASIIGELSNALLPAALREAVKDAAELTLFAPGLLSSVPFAALSVDSSDVRLGERVQILSLPFLADVTKVMPRLRTRFPPGVWWVWVPGFESARVVGDPAAGNDAEFILPPLPGARAEARHAVSAFAGRLLEGEEARARAVSDAFKESDFFYFAGHAVADPDDPLDRSFLAVHGGRLTAREIQYMTAARAPVVVLSACQTGGGRAMTAGMVGLARAFRLAGAAAVVVSLWSVNDEATARLMQTFINRLRIDPPAEALRAAVADAREHGISLLDRSAFIVFASGTMTR